MRFDHLGGKRFELTIGTLRALVLLFVAQTIHPFIFTDGRISAFPCLGAVVPACIHIFPTFEYREEKLNFLLCGTVCMNRCGMRILSRTTAPKWFRAYRPLAAAVLTEYQRLVSV